MHQFTNALVHETSPYLLQHAHNPVNWRPWGKEAFEEARKEDKPIFLSVGYATCYWCHVMERESFEDEEIARVMNEHFVCIKVDREERPDVDDVYMAATQIVSGGGGWPMSVFLEPKGLKPFYAGTYFPAEDKYGRPGFGSLLRGVREAWVKQRAEIDEQADKIAEAIEAVLSRKREPVKLGSEVVRHAIAGLKGSYDPEHGGFGGGGGGRNAPKFPMPAYLDFLMDAAWEDEGVRKMVRHTLDEMAMGGMYDQVGGGFHRYSTDERWLVPHFEKMLYDNGQLLSTYARAYELTGDDFYARVALRTAEYVLREMRNEEGMFFSAQDAEVDHREGLNYLWTKEDVAKVLQDAGMQNDVEFALKVYGLNDGVNFTDPHHPEDGGKNVLFLRDRPEETAKGIGISVEEYSAKLDAVNETLLKVRNVRKQPITDDKVLTGWNGLMIAGLADAGRVLHEKTYLVAAHIAAETVSKMMIAEDGRLMRSARAGRVHVDAFLEDYALLAHGLIALHRATGNVRWIEEATELMKEAMNRFGDSERGGFFDVQEGRQELFVRTKGIHDGAVPSGNSVMLVNMHSLLEVTGETQWMHGFNIALSGISASVQESPTGSIVAASALWKFLSHTAELLPQKHANTAATLGPVSFRVLTRADASDGCRSVSIVLEIARGYHVNAHEPGVDGLIGLRIHALNDDAKLHVTYPEARRLDDENSPYVYENGDVITCMVESEQDVELAIRFQACNDRMCLAPATHIVKATLTS